MKANGEPTGSGGVELNQLVDRIQHLKQEHAPLVSKIRGDAGMSATLRQELLDHLNEEEAEIITKMKAISPQVASRYRPSAAGTAVGAPAPSSTVSPRAAHRLTVGSLRSDLAQGGAPRNPGPSADARSSTRARLAIGSLRHR